MYTYILQTYAILTTIWRSAVREASAFRNHRGQIKGPSKIPPPSLHHPPFSHLGNMVQMGSRIKEILCMVQEVLSIGTILEVYQKSSS